MYVLQYSPRKIYINNDYKKSRNFFKEKQQNVFEHHGIKSQFRDQNINCLYQQTNQNQQCKATSTSRSLRCYRTIYNTTPFSFRL